MPLFKYPRVALGTCIGMQVGMNLQVLTERIVAGIHRIQLASVRAASATAAKAGQVADAIHQVGLASARAAVEGGQLFDELVAGTARLFRGGAD